VSGWRKLPHLKPEVAKLFDYPQQFAEDIFNRIEQALRRQADSKASLIPDLPVRYIGSSDMEIVAAHKADFYDEPRLSSELKLMCRDLVVLPIRNPPAR
jgi:hypothetical protein